MAYYRRSTPRAEPDERVFAFWSSGGPGDLSRVRNFSLGGVFIETDSRKELGTPVEIYFLVGEGQICAKAVVRHADPESGLGLKFTTLDGLNLLRFGALMKRLYASTAPVAALHGRTA